MDLFWLNDQQLARLRPYFPKSRGQPRRNDLQVLSGIPFVLRSGCRWRDAPSAYGSWKSLFTRYNRWSKAGVFQKILEGFREEKREITALLADATYYKAHRTACSLKKTARRGTLVAPEGA
jgi:transposase